MAVKPRVEITGLAELRRAFRKLEDADGLTEVRDGLREAAEVVADDARRRVPRRTGKTAQTVRAGTSGNKAYVAGGKKLVPHYGWLDFGGRTPISGRPRSVGPWKGTGAGPKNGRAIYPALDAKERDVERIAGRAMQKAIKRLDLD